MSIVFKSFNDIPASEWATFVDACDECWLYHRPEFIQYEQKKSFSFAIIEHSEIKGICVLYKNKEYFDSFFGYRIGPAGLALSNSFQMSREKLYRNILKHLLVIAAKNDCSRIQLNMPSLAPANNNRQYDDSHLYQLGFSISLRWGRGDYTPALTGVIDLQCDRRDFMDDFSETHRRACNRCLQQPYSYHYYCSDNMTEDAWNEFVTNHKETMQKTGGTPLSDSLRALFRELVKKGFFSLINLRIGDERCTSLLIATYKGNASYYASGMNYKFRDSGAGIFIHLLAMQELQRRNFKFYDIGPFFPGMHNTKMGLIGEFKRRFGGSKWPLLAGERMVNYSSYIVRAGIINTMKQVLQGTLPNRGSSVGQ